jgi:hypothetical protein
MSTTYRDHEELRHYSDGDSIAVTECPGPGCTYPGCEIPCPATHPEHDAPCICVAHGPEVSHRDAHGCVWQDSPGQRAQAMFEAITGPHPKTDTRTPADLAAERKARDSR